MIKTGLSFSIIQKCNIPVSEKPVNIMTKNSLQHVKKTSDTAGGFVIRLFISLDNSLSLLPMFSSFRSFRAAPQ